MLQEVLKHTIITWIAILITAIDPSSQNLFLLLLLEIKMSYKGLAIYILFHRSRCLLYHRFDDNLVMRHGCYFLFLVNSCISIGEGECCCYQLSNVKLQNAGTWDFWSWQCLPNSINIHDSCLHKANSDMMANDSTIPSHLMFFIWRHHAECI